MNLQSTVLLLSLACLVSCSSDQKEAKSDLSNTEQSKDEILETPDPVLAILEEAKEYSTIIMAEGFLLEKVYERNVLEIQLSPDRKLMADNKPIEFSEINERIKDFYNWNFKKNEGSPMRSDYSGGRNNNPFYTDNSKVEIEKRISRISRSYLNDRAKGILIDKEQQYRIAITQINSDNLRLFEPNVGIVIRDPNGVSSSFRDSVRYQIAQAIYELRDTKCVNLYGFSYVELLEKCKERDYDYKVKYPLVLLKVNFPPVLVDFKNLSPEAK